MPADLNSKCRTCLSDSNNHHHLFDYVEENYNILEMLDGVVPQIHIKTSRQVSTLVCQSCVNKLLVSYKFQQLCIETNNRLHNLLGNTSSKPQTDQILNPCSADSGLKAKQELEEACANDWAPNNGDESDTDSRSHIFTNAMSDEFPDEMEEFLYEEECNENVQCKNFKLGQQEKDVNCTHRFQEKNFEANGELSTKSGIFEQSVDGLQDDAEWINNVYENSCEGTEATEFVDAGSCEVERPEGSNTEDSGTLRSENFICSYCHRCFKNLASLSIHCIKNYRYNSKDSSYSCQTDKHKCNHCGRTFSQYSHILGHLKNHEEKKTSSCSICGKKFERHFSLLEHMRSHSGEKPCRCTECGKTFRYSGSLKAHMRSHSGERPYKCSQCFKAFLHPRSLKDHMRLHGENPFKCTQCGKYLSKSCSLREHMERSCRYTKNQCPKCPRRFRGKSALAKHEKKVHFKVASLESLNWQKQQTSEGLQENEDVKADNFHDNMRDAIALPQVLKEKIGPAPQIHQECTPDLHEILERSITIKSGDHHRRETHNLTRSSETNYSCMVCQHNFISVRSLTEHVTSQHPEIEKHQCEHCGETFALRAHLWQHLYRHDGKRNFVCIICRKVFRNISGLRQHIRKHSPYLCIICDKAFRFSNSYRRHMKLHMGLRKYDALRLCKTDKQDNYKYPCKACRKMFNHHSELKRHVSTVHSLMRPHKCVVCNYRFVTVSTLKLHLSQHKYEIGSHRDSPSRLEKEATPLIVGSSTSTRHQIPTGTALETNFSCLICRRTFKSVRALTVHYARKHPEVKKHKCNQCKKAFVQHEHLVEHLNYHKEFGNLSRGPVENINGRNDIFPCETCGKIFEKSYLLKRHNPVHSPTKPYECEICKYRFNTIKILKGHMSGHTNASLRKRSSSDPEIFQCPDCPRWFEKLISLSMHRLSHSRSNSEANYSCAVCPGSFNSIKTLTSHVIKKHPEEKHKCNQCDKIFVLDSKLQRHLNHHKKRLQIQSGERPYVCSECGKKFRTSINFKDHMRKHSGEKPFLCSHCGKTFRYPSNFHNHLKRHAGLLNFQCPLCPSRYVRRADLLRHVRTAKYHSKMDKLEKPYKINGKKFDMYRINDKEGGETASKNSKKILTFQCPDCPKSFEKLASLATHHKKHLKALKLKRIETQMRGIEKVKSQEKTDADKSTEINSITIVKEEIEIYEKEEFD